jgi:hypothetical protein
VPARQHTTGLSTRHAACRAIAPTFTITTSPVSERAGKRGFPCDRCHLSAQPELPHPLLTLCMSCNWVAGCKPKSAQPTKLPDIHKPHACTELNTQKPAELSSLTHLCDLRRPLSECGKHAAKHCHGQHTIRSNISLKQELQGSPRPCMASSKTTNSAQSTITHTTCVNWHIAKV